VLLIAAALAAGWLGRATTAAAADPGRGEFFGANTQGVVSMLHMTTWPKHFDRMAAMGLTVARADANWRWVEPSAPSGGTHNYNWATLDKMVEAIAGAGIRWHAVIAQAPWWASKDGYQLHPDYYGDYVAYSAALARRYGPGGDFWTQHRSLPYRPVTEFDVWSEPNSANFWAPTPDPKEYMRVYLLTRDAIAAANPSAKTLFSLGWQDFEAYVKAALEDGGPVDGISYNPYGLTADATLDLVRRLHFALSSVGRSGVPIDVSEFGLPSSRLGNSSLPPEETRAATLGLTGEALSRSDCPVDRYLVYSLAQPQTDPKDYQESMGLLDISGSYTITGELYRDLVARASSARSPSPLPLCSEAPEWWRLSEVLPDLSVRWRESLLSIAMNLDPQPDGCWSARVRYTGLPLEDATIRFRSTNPRYRRQMGFTKTDRNGGARFCFPGAAVRKGEVWAEVPRVAASAVVDLGDKVPPVISRFSFSKRRLDLRPRRRPRAYFRYVLNEAGSVRIKIRRLRGPRLRSFCRQARVTRRTCLRTRRSGVLRQTGRVGRNRLRFGGSIRSRALAPGEYRAVITAEDLAGNRAKPRAVRVTVNWRKAPQKG
jgi:polysaccharide biosynthesis protein PslG